MNILRFACGAASPPFEGSFENWVRGQIKELKGYALGRRKDDGRLRVMVFDLNGGITRPKMPNGDGAHCLACPCAGEAGRKELNGVPLDPRHGRRIVVTCYPEEVSVDATRKVASATPDVAPATPRVAGLHGEGQCDKVEHDGRTGYLHGPEDDSPYDVDGVHYCGRCHGAMIERERSEK